MDDADLDALVANLRAFPYCEMHQDLMCIAAADAITALRAQVAITRSYVDPANLPYLDVAMHDAGAADPHAKEKG